MLNAHHDSDLLMLEYYETNKGYTRLVVGRDKSELDGERALRTLMREMRQEATQRCIRMKEFPFELGKRAFYCDFVFDSMKHVHFEYNYREKEIRIGTIFDLSANF